MVEKDLEKIRRVSEACQDENWKFRSWLKFHEPDNIDQIVAGLSKKYFKLIDCKECGNCCRSLAVTIDKKELLAMANAKNDNMTDFERKFTVSDEDGDRVLKSPCPMLDGNLCSIYSHRPDTCRTFPHLEKPGFVSRLIGVIGSLSVCPIAFNVFEDLKGRYKWRGRDDD